MIGKTHKRLLRFDDAAEICTVTNRNFLFLTLDAYAENPTSEKRHTFLLEPSGRDTAAAVALAAIHAIQEHGPDAELLIAPADQLIEDNNAFVEAVSKARVLARENKIVTFGIRPERPETGYGYVEVAGSSVVRFVEKPDAETAKSFLEQGNYLWNAGMFCFTAGTMIEAMTQHCPEILEHVQLAFGAAEKGSFGDNTTLDVPKSEFEAVPATSIDYAVMEKANDIACVEVSCGWSDIGSWSAMSQLLSADENNNRVVGETIVEQTTNSFVLGEDRLISLVGVSDLLVVDTPDALLVAHKNKDQDVKAVFNRLKDQSHEAAKLHRTAHRPWGTYTVLEEGSGFKIKRIEVKPGGRLSLQAHHHRSEHWVVVSGSARVVNGDDEILLSTNQSTYIPCGHKHRLENPGQIPLTLIEVQTGEYLGEDDIVRFEDVYGRS